jgi:glycosyltransferase involved in cell wall biosynthesis
VKALYFSRDYTPHDHRFLSRLAKTDFDVYFMQMEGFSFNREDRPIPEGITKIAWDRRGQSSGLGNIWNNRKGFRTVLNDLQPDLVHAGPVQETSYLTALVGYSPLVTMSWGFDLLLGARKGLGRRIASYTLGKTAVFLCDCDAVAQVAHSLGMPSERIIQFPWGVDLDHFSPGEGKGLREALGWEGATILLSTRNWEPIYGVEIVCQAFVDVARENEDTRLLLVGDGSLRDEIERIIRASGFENRVHLAGYVSMDALPQYYRSADLYISASHVDGSSISLLEAMACGIPPLVSDIPGNQEWVKPGVNGWVFPDGSSEVLAETILAVMENPEQLRSFGESCRQIAEERADWNTNSQKLLDAYKLALSIERERL